MENVFILLLSLVSVNLVCMHVDGEVLNVTVRVTVEVDYMTETAGSFRHFVEENPQKDIPAYTTNTFIVFYKFK